MSSTATRKGSLEALLDGFWKFPFGKEALESVEVTLLGKSKLVME